MPSPASDGGGHGSSLFGDKLETPRGRHRQSNEFSDDDTEAAEGQALLHARQDVLLLVPLDEYDPVGMKADLRQRRHEEVGPRQAPCHLPLCPGGYGRSQRKQDGKWESSEERYSRFLQDRSELLSTDATRPFLASLALLAKVVRTKTVRKGTGSYWVKHIAENFECTYPEGEPLGPHYVPNGVLIAAAIHAGFLTKSHYDELGYHSLNVTFNMSKPCSEDLDYAIRPDSGRSQDRRREEERRASKRSGRRRWV